MKRFAMTLALACALSSTVLAGQIPSTDYVPPPPPQTAAPGDIPSTDADGDIPSVDFWLTILDFAF